MKVIKVGIAPQNKIRDRVLAIAKGEVKSKATDPKIWFTSLQSLLRALEAFPGQDARPAPNQEAKND
ncbi:MAG: hypothetical protein V4757_03895 [Pseudomonadota bacterium]